MVTKNLSNYVGASGDAAPRGMSSFAASLEAELDKHQYRVNDGKPFMPDGFGNMSVLLGCAGTPNQYVTQQQFVSFAMFIKSCFEAQGVHMDACINHLINCFTKITPAQEVTMLQHDNDFPYKDDQLVRPKDIQAYTQYSDTTVRKKLSKAVQDGLIIRYGDPILDENGNEQLSKDGRVRREDPRYLWRDVQTVFGPRRVEILKKRQKNQLEKARALQQRYAHDVPSPSKDSW